MEEFDLVDLVRIRTLVVDWLKSHMQEYEFMTSNPLRRMEWMGEPIDEYKDYEELSRKLKAEIDKR